MLRIISLIITIFFILGGCYGMIDQDKRMSRLASFIATVLFGVVLYYIWIT